MPIDEVVGGPPQEERMLVYARARMSESAIQNAEEMVLGSPSREVGKGALHNVMTLFNSKKNGVPRYLESHTCELLHAYELELDPEVIGYYTQVACQRVERTTQHGRRHVTVSNLDFLVFMRDGVRLTECKTLKRIEREVEKGSADWIKKQDSWTHVAYQHYAFQHELGFQVWTPPKHVGIYLQNLEAIYAVAHIGASNAIERVARRALQAIEKKPRSLFELKHLIDGFHERVALWMLGKHMAYGPCVSTSMQQDNRFILYVDEVQAKRADAANTDEACALFDQPSLRDPLLMAGKTDVKRGHRRLRQVEAVMSGETVPSKRLKAVVCAVQNATINGADPLSTCITGYIRSGNRVPRLGEPQIQAIEHVVKNIWNRGLTKRKVDLYHFLRDRCSELGIELPGITALKRRLRYEDPARHALAVGGLRAYHATRPSIDTRNRSLSPLGCGHTIHIDSSKFDNRVAPDILKKMPAMAGTFYVAVDGATEETVAHAFIFGPARTDGVAILLRNYVRRTGCLPAICHFDRGPENRSRFVRSFAEESTSIKWSPTAGSQWNGIAENIIKHVNQSVAHRLIGSTEPDQAGRKVDGRFKSEKNAKTSFSIIQAELCRYLYEDLPITPGLDGLTPSERKEQVMASFGDMGTPCEFDDEFRIKTSIDVAIKKNINPRKGVRTEEGFFTSDELIDLLRKYPAVRLKSDCEDPTILWVRIGGGWTKVFHSRVQTLALCSVEDKLFDLMYAPFRRSNVRRDKVEVDYQRHKRLRWANFLSEQAHATRMVGDGGADTETVSLVEKPSADDMVTRKNLWNGLEPLEKKGE